MLLLFSYLDEIEAQEDKITYPRSRNWQPAPRACVCNNHYHIIQFKETSYMPMMQAGSEHWQTLFLTYNIWTNHGHSNISTLQNTLVIVANAQNPRQKWHTHRETEEGRPSSRSSADLSCPRGRCNEGDRKEIANVVRWLWSGQGVLEISTNTGLSPWAGVNIEWTLWV